MPTTGPSGAPSNRFFLEPQRALLTPSASPSLGPPDRPAKRPRHRSTPSSSISTTPSTSNESTSSADVNSARRASTLRVLNTWAQLAERHNKPLDEDDIIDLHSFVIIKDRGVVKGAPGDYHIGHFTQLDSDQDYPDADQDQEDSDQDDEDELNALPPSENTTDDDPPISKKELLRGVPPLSATTDAEDLREFLAAEKKRREIVGDEEDEEDMSPEQLSALRKALEEQSQEREAVIANLARDVASVEHPLGRESETTPTRPSTHVPPSDDESEDELGLWTHDESTAVYPVTRGESEQDVHKAEREVIELTESDSDEEFEALLTRPPRFTRVSPPPIPNPKEAQQPFQSPPDSERGRSKYRSRPHSRMKSTEVMSKSEDQPRSTPVLRKPEVTLTHKRKSSPPKEADTSNDGESDQQVVGHSPVCKGKGKETPFLVQDRHHERTPKTLGVVSRVRKRKRITSSSTSGIPLAQSPAEPKSTLRSHGRSTSPSQSPTTLPQPGGPKPTLTKDISTPVRFEPSIAGSSRSLSSFSSASKIRPPSLSGPGPTYRSLEPESGQPASHDHNPNGPLLSDPSIPVTHPYSQRYPSHPPSFFFSPDQGTPGLSLPVHPPPPIDPVQTQQAQYLLAQAVHQLSYLISATMPSCAAYASNPGQPWHHPPPPPPPHIACNTPNQHPPHFHGTCHYHTPSSSISRSGLPPSSPVQPSVSSPVEGRARSRGRSKSRGRRVSFKLDSEEVIGSREHDFELELHTTPKNRRQTTLEVQRGREKGKQTEEFNNSLWLEEDRGRPPQEAARGRTPGPPRSLSRRSRA